MKPLVPLRDAIRDGSADEADVRLADALAAIPGEPETDASAGFDRVEGSARSIAHSRRRRFLATELFRLLHVRRVFAAGVAAALVAVVWTVEGTRLGALWNGESYVSSGGVAVTPGATPAKVRLANGAAIELSGTGYVDAAGSVRLENGITRLRIPRLANGESFRVSTPDADVIVHGTRFSVERTGDETRVSVKEGLVEVRSVGGQTNGPVFVRPGESTAVPSVARFLAETEARARAVADSGNCEDESSVEAYLRVVPAGADASLFQYFRGYCAYQRRDLTAALPFFEAVAERSGNGIRDDNAAARVAQIRAAKDPASAANAWKAYLDRFPNGAHRVMAHDALRASME